MAMTDYSAMGERMRKDCPLIVRMVRERSLLGRSLQLFWEHIHRLPGGCKCADVYMEHLSRPELVAWGRTEVVAMRYFARGTSRLCSPEELEAEYEVVD